MAPTGIVLRSRETMAKRGAEKKKKRAEAGTDSRGPEKQGEARKTEREAEPWLEQNSQHGIPLQAIVQEERQRPGVREDTWVIK